MSSLNRRNPRYRSQSNVDSPFFVYKKFGVHIITKAIFIGSTVLLFIRRLCPGGIKSCIFGEWTFYDEGKETVFSLVFISMHC
jgi:hypothetical protein